MILVWDLCYDYLESRQDRYLLYYPDTALRDDELDFNEV